MALWQDTADGHYCATHDYHFSRGDVCGECVSAGDSVEPSAPIVHHNQALSQRISGYRARARKLRAIADDLYNADGDGESWHAVNAGSRLDAEATKLDRLAEERQEVLDNREHDLELIRHEREMSGLRGSH